METAEDLYQLLLESKRRAFDDPSWFFTTILNCVESNALEPWQLEGIEAIADVHRKLKGRPTKINHEGLSRLSYRSCHGPGKTHWLALLMHWWNYCFYGRIVCTAPKEKQLKTRLWPRYRKILRHAQPSYREIIKVGVIDIKILNDEDWGCIGETASDPDNMSGYHDEPQLFLVDEGSAKTLDPMFPVMEGTLTTPGSVLVMIGNPTRTTGEFHASHNKAGTKELYFQRHIQPKDSRFIDPKWVKNMIRKYGRKSPVVAVRVFGEFASMEENQLVALEWVEAARDKIPEEDGSIPSLRVSVDVADGGEDETVVTVAKRYHSFVLLLKQYRFNFASSVAPIESAEAAERIFLAAGGDKKTDDIVVDAIGVGAGTAGTLIKSGYNVIAYKGGSSSDSTKLWRNRRTQSYMVLRDSFRDGEIIIDEDFLEDDDWDDFVAQVCSIKSKPGIEKVEDLETKQEMKGRGIKSPDMSDSVAMLYATQTPVGNVVHFTPEIVGSMEMDDYDAGLT